MLDTLQDLSRSLAGLVAGAAPSLVAVRSHRARSSGFAIAPDLVATADEALAEEGEVAAVLPGGRHVAASVVGRDPSTDVALLRLDGADLPPVSLDGAALPPAGSLALALGAAEGGEPVAAFGAVALSGPAWRSVRGGEIDGRVELDLNLRRHAEGGLALDATGGAIGMTVFGPRRRALVIPASTVRRVARELETHGRARRGYLGIGFQAVRLDGGAGDETGLMAMSVDRDGPAARAGVRQGDVVTHWDGEPVHSPRALLRRLGSASVGTEARLTLRRGGEAVAVTVAVGERPDAP